MFSPCVRERGYKSQQLVKTPIFLHIEICVPLAIFRLNRFVIKKICGEFLIATWCTLYKIVTIQH